MFTQYHNSLDFNHPNNLDYNENQKLEIYLKDKSFLPDSIEIFVESSLSFINHEDIGKLSYRMCCKDSLHWESKVWHILPQQKQDIKFDTPGRYLFSCPEISSMMIIVTVNKLVTVLNKVPRYFPTAKDRDLKIKETNDDGQNYIEDNEPESYWRDFLQNSNLKSASNIPDFEEISKNPSFPGNKKSNNLGYYSDTDEDFDLTEERRNMKREIKHRQRKKTRASTVFSLRLASSPNKKKENSSESFLNESYNKLSSTDRRKSPETNIKIRNSKISPTSSPQQVFFNDRSIQQSSVDIVQNKNHHDKIIILIQDYDFSIHHIDIFVNQEIEFSLSKDVPHHAEHQLVGISTLKSLCFESPLLQILEDTTYSFVPTVSGEIIISCKIYPDMICAVNVLNSIKPFNSDSKSSPGVPSNNENQSFISSQESSMNHTNNSTPEKIVAADDYIITGISDSTLFQSGSKLDTKYENLLSRNGETSESQSSFLDSDDVFSSSDNDLNEKSVTSDGSIFSSNLYYKEWNMHHRLNEKLNKLSHHLYPTRSTNINNQRISPTKNVTHCIEIDEFSFKPETININCGDTIRFYRGCEGSTINIFCTGEFEISLVGKGDAFFSHKFLSVGEFLVKSEIYDFMQCKVFVKIVNNIALINSSVFPIRSTFKLEKISSPPLMGSFAYNISKNLSPDENIQNNSKDKGIENNIESVEEVSGDSENDKTVEVLDDDKLLSRKKKKRQKMKEKKKKDKTKNEINDENTVYLVDHLDDSIDENTSLLSNPGDITDFILNVMYPKSENTQLLSNASIQSTIFGGDMLVQTVTPAAYWKPHSIDIKENQAVMKSRNSAVDLVDVLSTPVFPIRTIIDRNAKNYKENILKLKTIEASADYIYSFQDCDIESQIGNESNLLSDITETTSSTTTTKKPKKKNKSKSKKITQSNNSEIEQLDHSEITNVSAEVSFSDIYIESSEFKIASKSISIAIPEETENSIKNNFSIEFVDNKDDKNIENKHIIDNSYENVEVVDSFTEKVNSNIIINFKEKEEKEEKEVNKDQNVTDSKIEQDTSLTLKSVVTKDTSIESNISARIENIVKKKSRKTKNKQLIISNEITNNEINNKIQKPDIIESNSDNVNSEVNEEISLITPVKVNSQISESRTESLKKMLKVDNKKVIYTPTCASDNIDNNKMSNLTDKSNNNITNKNDAVENQITSIEEFLRKRWFDFQDFIEKEEKDKLPNGKRVNIMRLGNERKIFADVNISTTDNNFIVKNSKRNKKHR